MFCDGKTSPDYRVGTKPVLSHLYMRLYAFFILFMKETIMQITLAICSTGYLSLTLLQV